MAETNSNHLDSCGQVVRVRTAFDVHFTRHVMPRMAEAIRFGAALVRYDLETFTDAATRALRIGCKRGLSHCSEVTLNDLTDWVDIRLLHMIDHGVDPPGLITPQQLDQLTRTPTQETTRKLPRGSER